MDSHGHLTTEWKDLYALPNFDFAYLDRLFKTIAKIAHNPQKSLGVFGAYVQSVKQTSSQGRFKV